jgi:hypothetical protein
MHVEVLYSTTDFTFLINKFCKMKLLWDWLLECQMKKCFSSLKLQTLNLITYLQLNRVLRSHFCNAKQGKQSVILHILINIFHIIWRIHLYDSAYGLICHKISSSRHIASAIHPWFDWFPCRFSIVTSVDRKYKVVHVLAYLPSLDIAVRPNNKSGLVSGNSMDNFQVAT